MAAPARRHSARLMALLHGFGLGSAELANQQPKAVMSTLRAEYYRLAKERHPDLVPAEQKAEASKRFVQLQSDFSEAVKLLEAGITPWMSPPMGGMQQQEPGVRKMYAPPFRTPYGYYGAGYNPLQPMEFDLKTRIKGHAVFWSGLFLFLCFFREFLVWSAGSTYAWSPPKDANIFWVRRFKDEWMEDSEAKKRAEAAKEAQAAEQERKQKAAAALKAQRAERGVDNFYQKRGISNVRKKTEPRGWGPSL